MKVCIIVTGLPPAFIGGTETQTYNLAANISKRHDVTVLTRRTDGMPAESRGRGFTIKRFWFLDFPVIRFITHTLSCLNEIRKLKDKTDVFYCMMLSPNGFAGALGKKLFGIKTVASVRGGDWYTPGFFGGLINRFVIGNSDLIAVQTEHIRKDVIAKFPDASVEVIPNGVDIKGERASGDKVIFLGNLWKRKGVEYLVRAMEKVDGELIIAGDGEEKEALEALVKDMGLKKKVNLIGAVRPKDVRGLLRKGKVFVLPSLYGEGQPNVILEAMSVGLPVISTKVSGIPDMIKDGETGFLLEPGNSELLARAMNRILKDKRLHLKMSQEALEDAKKHSWDIVSARLESVVASLMHKSI